MVTMIATVLRIDRQSLLVRNEATGEEFLVHYRNPGAFAVGDRVRILYNGQATFSIPPQINAISIQKIGTPTPCPSCPTPSPDYAQMRATVLQVGNGFLMVRNSQGQLMRVNFNQAYHFCVGQQVTVRYDSIMLTNPPRVNAVDIIPVC